MGSRQSLIGEGPSPAECGMAGKEDPELREENARLKKAVKGLKKKVENLNSELYEKVSNLSDLYRAGMLLTSTLDLEEILVLLMELALKMIEGEVGSIMLLEGGDLTTKITWGLEDEVIDALRLKTGENIACRVLKTAEPVLVNDLKNDSRFVPKRVKVLITSLLCVPLKAREKVVGVLNVINRAGGEAFTEIDTEMVYALAGHAAVAIENARLHQETLEKERYERELAIAHDIQMGLLPEAFPRVDGLYLKAKCLPAMMVGGDYYDFIEMDNGRLGIVMGDVSGRGVPAALLMTTIRAVMRVEAGSSHSAKEVISKVNVSVCHDVKKSEGMFASLFYGIVNKERRTLRYTNAGHCYPVVFHRFNGEAELLKRGGTCLGLFEDSLYEEGEMQLIPGDLILFYTDGMIETVNNRGERFGKERLYRVIAENKLSGISGLTDKVYQTIFSFTGDMARQDDMTLLLMKVG